MPCQGGYGFKWLKYINYIFGWISRLHRELNRFFCKKMLKSEAEIADRTGFAVETDSGLPK
jgi:hypothetical protein|tara:strand:+ start:585 stop:767 length:183 start_codon:yes stop_codon:yes gene_type:complete